MARNDLAAKASIMTAQLSELDHAKEELRHLQLHIEDQRLEWRMAETEVVACDAEKIDALMKEVTSLQSALAAELG